MPNSVRTILAVVTGFFIWATVATILNFGVRWLMPDYVGVEKSMDFTLAMQIARLMLGAAASLAAGAACVLVGRGIKPSVYILAALMLVLFVPMHIGLWDKFPVWYHLIFLGTLVPLVFVGAKWKFNPEK